MGGQDRTGQDRTGQDRTGQDRTGQDRTGQEQRPILLVDDQKEDVESFVGMLKKNNFKCHVVVVENQEGALEYLFRVGRFSKVYKLPVAILLDPASLTGYANEFVNIVGSYLSTQSIPIILFSTKRFSFDRTPIKFLHKPADYNAFSMILREVGLDALL